MEALSQLCIHVVDDNILHHHALESVVRRIPSVSLRIFHGTQILAPADSAPDVLLVSRDSVYACSHHLVYVLRGQYPGTPVICYASSAWIDDACVMPGANQSAWTVSYEMLIRNIGRLPELVQSPDSGHLDGEKCNGENMFDRDWRNLRELSPREREIFCLVGKGLGAVEIGEMIECGTRTVETHLQKIRYRLNLGNLVDMRRLAIRLMRSNQCKVFSDQDDHFCRFIDKSIGECPYL